MLKRVFKVNGLEIEAHQYIGTGPLLVKLPDDRGEMKARSTDYLLYLGGVVAAVVPAALINSMALPVEETVYEEKVVPVGDSAEGIVVTKRIVAADERLEDLDVNLEAKRLEDARIEAERRQADIDSRVKAGETVVVQSPRPLTPEEVAVSERSIAEKIPPFLPSGTPAGQDENLFTDRSGAPVRQVGGGLNSSMPNTPITSGLTPIGDKDLSNLPSEQAKTGLGKQGMREEGLVSSSSTTSQNEEEIARVQLDEFGDPIGERRDRISNR